jgi:serine/threonine protein kinase/streptogramin lyase
VTATGEASRSGGGRRIGRYEVVRVLGRGGMAVVYLARQSDLDRLVALKELSQTPGQDPSFAQRFVRESRLTGSLAHPNIVVVHEFFEEQGTPYIAMEYIPGGSLRPYIGTLARAQVAGVLEGILAGLAHAEHAGVVHRDLKPENLMVTGEGRIKITDFGIARATTSAETKFVTATGTTVGTPSYMAPEQAMGKDIGSWTDLYATGVIAYELLGDRLPFPQDEAPMAILMRHINEDPPHLLELQPELDPRLAEWVMGLLRKAPHERPSAAEPAWHELEDVLIEVLGPRWRREARLPPEPGTRVTHKPLTPAPFESRRTPTPGPAPVVGVPGAGEGESEFFSYPPARGPTEAPPAEPPPPRTTPAQPPRQASAPETVAPSSTPTPPSETVAPSSTPTPPPPAVPTEPAPPPTEPTEPEEEAPTRPPTTTAARRRLFAVLGVIGVLAVVGIFVLTGGGGDSAPERNGGGGGTGAKEVKLGAAVAAGDFAVGVTVIDDRLLVGDRNSGELQVLDAGSGKPTHAALRVGGTPQGVDSGPIRIWVANEASNTVSRFDEGDLSDLGAVDVAPQPRDVAAGQHATWVASASGVITRVDPVGAAAPVPIQVGGEPQGIDAMPGSDAVWYSDRSDGTLHQIDPATNRATKEVKAGEDPKGVLVAASGAIWVANTGSDNVMRFDAQGASKRVFRVGGEPRELAEGFGSIWVTCGKSEDVYRLDAKDGDVQSVTPVKGSPEGIGVAEDAGKVWVALGDKGQIVPLEVR